MSSENDKDNSDPTAESTTTKAKVPSASTKTVWKSSDDAVLVATLLKEREEGRQSDSGFKPKSFAACAEALKGSERTSGGIAKTSGSCHDHWGKVCLLLSNHFTTCFDVLSAQKGLRCRQTAQGTVWIWLGQYLENCNGPARCLG